MTRGFGSFGVLASVAGLALLASGSGHAESDEPLHPVQVHNPRSLGTVDTGMRDASGASVGIACATCHDPNHPDALARKNEVPPDFHRGIQVVHGTLRCASCHAPQDRTQLRLADGRSIPIRDVIELCGQCHGPKLRDFRKGSHGGGRGYWDRSQGPWVRNNCVACHAAHAPAYPLVMPAAPPNDRFLPTALPSAGTAGEPAKRGGEGEHE